MRGYAKIARLWLFLGVMLAAVPGLAAAQAATGAPVLTNATVTPATLPVTGGTLTVSTTVTDPSGSGITSVTANLFRDGFYYTTLYLSGSGGSDTGTFTFYNNTDSTPHTYTATITASNGNGQSATVTASGSCVQANDNQGPSVTNATLSPASLPVTGGTLTVTATVADPNGRALNGVTATIYQDGIYYTSLGLSSSGGGAYAGTFTLSNNTDAMAHTYTATVTATNDLNLSTTAAASGSCVQANDSRPLTITDVTLSPASLPAAGGNLTVTATITAPDDRSINNVYATIYRNGGSSTSVSMTAGADGVYRGTYNPGSNTTAAPVTYTATVTATNDLNLSTTASASGSCVQANDATPLTVTDATLTPATLPVGGGTITITATVTAPAGHSVNSVYATLYTGNDYYATVTLSNGGGGSVYTGTYNPGGNSSLFPHIFTATITATNDLNLATTAEASGSCTQANDTAPPSVTNAALGPATLPAAGGTITVTATVSDPNGEAITGVYATLYQNGNYYASTSLTGDGSGNYTGTFSIGGNGANGPVTYTAQITATNDAGLSTTVAATGSCTQANDNSAPSITNAAESPATLPITGGTINVSATVTDPNGEAITGVYATLYQDGNSVESVSLNGDSSGNYTGTFTIGANADPVTHVYTVQVTAINDVGLATTVTASGQTSQPGSGTASANAPSISDATLTPATLPATGGQITVSATVTDPSGSGLTNVYATLYRDGFYYTSLSLSSGGGGGVGVAARGHADPASSTYSGTLYLGPNTDSAAHTYTATVTATNGLNLSTTAAASGSCVQANDNTPPSVTDATLTPETLPASGGTITVSATVTDPNGEAITGVYAYIYRDGFQYSEIYLGSAGGNSYSGTFYPANNTDPTPHVYTATVIAYNGVGLSTTVPASGSCTQSNDYGPLSITDATMTPASLPAAGGTLTVTATITAPDGHSVNYVYATIYRNGGGYTTISLSNGGSGSVYTGTYNAGGNASTAPLTYTATVTGGNESYVPTTVAASGSCVQANDATPLTVTDATLTPASLPAAGGTITVTATVTAPDGHSINSVYAELSSGTGYYAYVYMSNGGSGSIFTGTYNPGGNTGPFPRTFTAAVTATNDFGLATTVAASGSCTQANEPVPPSITNATLTPATLPVTGGTLTVTATVTVPNGETLTNVYGYIYRNGYYYTTAYLTAGSGGTFSGTVNIGANTDVGPYTFTARVAAYDDAGSSTIVLASGQTVQPNDNTPPSVTNATLTPATLPVAGGTITISATVTDPNGRALNGVYAYIFRDGFYITQIGLTAGANGAYTGTYNVPADTDATSHTYTATLTAYNDLNTNTSVPVSGTCVQGNDNVPPSITNASISPASLPVTGGQITVTATVTDPNGRAITGVTAELFRDGTDTGQGIGLTAGGGGVYSGAFTIGPNTDAAPHVYTATVTATNDLSLSATVTAAGQTTQPNDNTPPVITNATISPATLTASGGTITVTATVTDPGGRPITGVTAAVTDGTNVYTVSLSNGGSGSLYTGTFTAGPNTGTSAITYTAKVTATDDLGLSTTVSATGQTAEGIGQPPQIVSATLTPAAIPASGGTITVTATVTDAQGVRSVTAAIMKDGAAYGQTLTLTNGGNGSVYTATFNPGPSTDTTAHVFTATVTATNILGVTVSTPAAGSCTQGAVAPNPAPTITGLSPSSAVAGTTGFVLTITGTGFVPSSTVGFGALTGLVPDAGSLTATQLTVAIPDSALASAGTANVTVTNPAPGGGTSAPATFTITPKVVALPTLSVTNLTFPSPASAHQTVTVSWTVVNTGPGDATTLWNDSVYLSPTPTLDTTNAQTMLLGTFASPTTLPNGASYTQSPSVILPGVPAGNYYIIVVADSGNAVAQTTRTGDTLAMPVTFQKVQTLLLTPSQSNLTLHVGTAQSAQLTLANLGSTPLTGLTATVSGAPANLTVQITAPDHLDPMTEQPVKVSVLANNASILTGTATVTITSADGQQVTATVALTVVTPQPNLVVTSDLLSGGVLTSGMVLGQQTVIQATVTNQGDATATGLQVAVPSLPWLTLSSPASIGDLPPGQSASIVLTLMPAANLPLAEYRGLIAVNGTNTSIPINFLFTAISTGVGSVKITTSDEFTYFADDHPPLVGAGVFLTNAVTGQAVTLTNNVTDGTGALLIPSLPAGPYQIHITSPNHASFDSTVLVTAGNETDVPAFLSRQLVTYQFTVIPIGIQDQYSVQIQAVFQTNVPAPVVTISPMQVDLTQLQYNQNGQATVYFTVTNHGLIAADDATLNLPVRSDFFLSTPMADLGRLAALSTVVVPVTITNTALAPAAVKAQLKAQGVAQPHDGGGACFSGTLSDSYFCGKKITQSAGVSFTDGPCPGGGLVFGGPIAGGPGGYIPYGGGSPPAITGIDICDPCTQMQLQSIALCLIGFIPGVPCIGAIGLGAVGCTDPKGCFFGAAGAAATCLGASYGVGAVINAIGCVATFPDCTPGKSGGASGKAAPAAAPHDLSLDPFLAQVQTDDARAQALVQPLVVFLGDPKWLDGQLSDTTVFSNFMQAFSAAITAPDGGRRAISDADSTALAALPLPTQITVSDVQTLVSRWNNTYNNYNAGIFNVSQAPAGSSTNFVDFQSFQDASKAAVEAINADKAEGGDGTVLNSLKTAVQQLQQNDINNAAQSGTCAKVKIELDQTVAITRTGFQATLELDNSSQSSTLTNVQVSLKVTDAFGNDQTSLFGITTPIVTGFTGTVDGAGSLGTGQSGIAQWTITPTEAAAANGTTRYFVTGTISYQQNGTTISIPLYPDQITVEPDPFLQLHYFLQQSVYGPDPNDPFNVNTPPEPFSLGLLAVNIGKGTAHDFSITTSQPKIVDNDKGLLVNFEVIGTQLNSAPVSPSLMIDFGDLTPVGTSGSTAAAQFLLTASLAGKFVGYGATFQHTDDLGANTSLIDSVDIHFLEHVVRNLWPTDDGKPDFLAEDVPNADGLPDTLWSSDNTTYPVASVDNAVGDTAAGGPITAGGQVGDTGLTTTLTVANPPTGYVYIRTDNPAVGNQQLLQVLRSDGTSLLIGQNVWTTDRYVHLTSGEIHERRLYLFDYNSTGRYTLVYGQAAPVNESIGGLKQIPDGTVVTIGQGPTSGTSGSGSSGSGSSGSGSSGSGGSTSGGGLAPSGPVIVTAVFPDAMYVESLDRSSGIRVTPPSANRNDLVVITGKMGTGANGERFIAATQTTPVGTGFVAPLGLTVKALYGGDNLNSAGVGQHGVVGGAGLNPVGLLTATLGKVISAEGGDFTLDDGFGQPVKVLLPSGVGAPTPGTFVGVSDVISLENDPDGLHPLLRPRSAGDIQTDVSGLNNTFTAPAMTLNKGQNIFSLPGVPVSPSPTAVLSGLTLADITGNLNRYDAPTQAEVFYDPTLNPFNLLNREGYRIQLNASQAQAEASLSFTGLRTDFADAWVSLPKLGATRIGDPFSFAVPWQNVQVTDGTKTVSVADAARVEAPAWLNSEAQYFDSVAQTPRVLGLPDDTVAPNSTPPDSTQLTPWVGYYVFGQRDDLALIVPVSAAPVLQGITPSTVQAGGPDLTLTVTGQNFVSGATVDWNGTPLVTTFVSGTGLTAVIPAADTAGAGTAAVTVVNPNGQSSGPLTFTVTPAPVVVPNPVPTLTSLSPESTNAGGLGVILTITGTNFVSGATVDWNGSPRTTAFLSSTQLTAQITAADIASPTTASVTVVNPAPGGGASSALPFLVTPATAADVTGSVSVTESGLLYNKIKRTFSGTITVTNTSAATVTGPIQLVFLGLPDGLTLTNATGTFQGNPYLTVSTAALASGGSITAPVQFQRTGSQNVTYTPEVYSGTF